MEVRYPASLPVELNNGVNAVMRIFVCPGNDDKGEACLAKTPGDTIFVEVFEFIYIICGLKH